jgi:hypothetical protein
MAVIKLIAPLLALTCASCASYYSAPTGASQATLRISASVDSRPGGVAYAQTFANDKCANTGSGNRLAVFTTRPGIQGKDNPHTGIDVPIPSEGEFIYSFYFSDGSSGVETANCAVTLGFQPETGQRYHTHLELLPQSCSVTLSRISPDGREELMNVPAMRKIEPACVNAISG